LRFIIGITTPANNVTRTSTPAACGLDAANALGFPRNADKLVPAAELMAPFFSEKQEHQTKRQINFALKRETFRVFLFIYLFIF
jgi:hypothetical protein